jgi:hypothetical protein
VSGISAKRKKRSLMSFDPPHLPGRKSEVKPVWLRRWGLLLGGVALAQLLIQGLNALSGMLLVWLLPRDTSYAWYTAASSMMLLSSMLTDSGLTAATNSLGGPIFRERTRFTQVIQSVLRHQRWVALMGVCLVIPAMLVLLDRIGAPAWGAGIAGVAIVVFTSQMAAAQVFSQVNRLHSLLHPQLKAELINAALRLALTLICLVSVWYYSGGGDLAAFAVHAAPGPLFVSVLLASAVPAVYFHQAVKSCAARVLDDQAASTYEFDEDIRRVIRQTTGFSLYYSLQGQVSVWLISWFGTSAQVADVGALGRLVMLFAVAGGPLVQVAGPAFARSGSRVQLRSQLFRVCGMYGLFSMGILLLALFLPGLMLWFLGPQYGHLTMELPLAVLGLAVAGYSGIMWGLVLARGWVKSSALIIPVGVATQIAGVFVFDFSTVAGVLGYNLFFTAPSVLLAVFIVRRGLRDWSDPVPVNI